MPEVTESAIRERLIRARDLQGKHEIAVALLKQEIAELEVAVRVFERFHGRPDHSNLLPTDAQANQNEAASEVKPPNTPKITEMITIVLADEALISGEWLGPKQIADRIRERWWASIQSSSVGPQAWRMANTGRLQRHGSLYTVPENETPAGPSAGASEQGELDVTELS